MTEHADCIFCRIAAGEIPSTTVYSDENVLAFRDIGPQAPTHILIIPRRHIPSIRDLGAGEGEILGQIFAAANRIADKEGIAERGYRTVINYGPESGHTVWHLHVHLVGGAILGGFGASKRS